MVLSDGITLKQSTRSRYIPKQLHLEIKLIRLSSRFHLELMIHLDLMLLGPNDDILIKGGADDTLDLLLKYVETINKKMGG